MFSTILAQTSNLEQIVGQYHALFAIFPLVLFTGALICDLLNTFGKRKALVVGHWLIIIGVILCMPTLLTGLEAAKDFNPDNDLLSMHRKLGFATAISGSLYAGLRISVMIWKIYIRPNLYLGMSILLVALASWTSDYGLLLSNHIEVDHINSSIPENHS